jgi:hypothetical protein
MSLSYEEALATLQSMFAEPWTRDTLDAILRHQKGHMENTVDFILRHSGKDPQTLVDQLKAGVNPDESTLSVDAELARQLSHVPAVAPVTGATTAARTGRGTPSTLPDGFLCIPGATNLTMMESDEALARMLQDEMFTGELANNPDLAHLARGQSARRASSNTTAQRAAQQQPTRSSFGGFPAMMGGNNNPNNPVNSPANIMKKIGELGDNARTRLQLLASQFQARTNNQQQNTAAASHAAGAPAPGAERRGLLDDNDHDDGFEFASRKEDF